MRWKFLVTICGWTTLNLTLRFLDLFLMLLITGLWKTQIHLIPGYRISRKLCDKGECQNGSLLRAKAHIFLAQTFQSDDNFEEAKQHIDAAKVSIFYFGLCMGRSAVANQEAFWLVGQCHGDMHACENQVWNWRTPFSYNWLWQPIGKLWCKVFLCP